MGLRDRLRKLEDAVEEELIVIPLRDGTVARFPPDAGMEAFMNFTDRLGAGDAAPPEHPLIAAVRNSTAPEWANSFFAVEDPDRWVTPIEDLSE